MAHDCAADLVDDATAGILSPGTVCLYAFANAPSIASIILPESLLHVGGLARLVLGPFPNEIATRECPFVLTPGRLAVRAFIRDQSLHDR